MSWQPSYATAEDAGSWLGIDADPQLALAVESASRAIDQATGRQFGQLDTPEPRWYAAEFHRGRWIVEIDDLMSTATVETVDEAGAPLSEITGFLLTPRNASSVDRPFTRIEILASSPVKPDHHGVQITAAWGWTAVPESIKLATLIQAGRFYERRENAAGQLNKRIIDDLEYDYAGATQDVDADVLASIRPFVKLWAAV